MSRILVTGTHGFVGSRIMEKYRDAVAVPSEMVRKPGRPLAEMIKKHTPELIINAAAISDIGQCERDPEGSYISNVTLPLVLARAAAQTGAKLLSFSSDQVYTGCRGGGPYRDDAELPPPANVYARHKLEGEQRVLDADPDAVLLRATWMYDMPIYGHANRGNMMTMMLSAMLHRRELHFSTHEMRGITYVRQVVQLLDSAAALPGGVYNWGSENTLSMLDTAHVLADALGLGDVAEQLILPADTSTCNLWMDCSRIKEHGIFFDTTAEGFRRCVSDYMQAIK